MIKNATIELSHFMCLGYDIIYGNDSYRDSKITKFSLIQSMMSCGRLYAQKQERRTNWSFTK